MDMEKDACEPLRVLRGSLCIRAGTYIATWSRLERDTHKKGAQVLLIAITSDLRPGAAVLHSPIVRSQQVF